VGIITDTSARLAILRSPHTQPEPGLVAFVDIVRRIHEA
jgi:hypothetical protein